MARLYSKVDVLARGNDRFWRKAAIALDSNLLFDQFFAFKRTIGGVIADLCRMGKSGSGPPIEPPKRVGFTQEPTLIAPPFRKRKIRQRSQCCSKREHVGIRFEPKQPAVDS